MGFRVQCWRCGGEALLTKGKMGLRVQAGHIHYPRRRTECARSGGLDTHGVMRAGGGPRSQLPGVHRLLGGIWCVHALFCSGVFSFCLLTPYNCSPVKLTPKGKPSQGKERKGKKREMQARDVLNIPRGFESCRGDGPQSPRP